MVGSRYFSVIAQKTDVGIGFGFQKFHDIGYFFDYRTSLAQIQEDLHGA